jgi:hypothetical protein
MVVSPPGLAPGESTGFIFRFDFAGGAVAALAQHLHVAAPGGALFGCWRLVNAIACAENRRIGEHRASKRGFVRMGS